MTPASFGTILRIGVQIKAIPPLWSTISSSDPSEIANMFADHFEQVYQSPIGTNEQDFDHIARNDVCLDRIALSYEEVYKAINSLDYKKGPGPDLIPPKFLKKTIKVPNIYIFCLIYL